jgi:hypothetical protein
MHIRPINNHEQPPWTPPAAVRNIHEHLIQLKQTNDVQKKRATFQSSCTHNPHAQVKISSMQNKSCTPPANMTSRYTISHTIQKLLAMKT